MSHWNYRVVKRTYPDNSTGFCIHEVYYDNDGEIEFWSTNPTSAFGETDQDLIDDLRLMSEALGLPVLDYDALPRTQNR